MTNQEAWQLLGIAPTNDKRAIRRAYAALARAHHAEEEPEKFAQIQEAYRIALEGAGSERYPSAGEMLFSRSGEEASHRDQAMPEPEASEQSTRPSYLERLADAEQEEQMKKLRSGAMAELVDLLQTSGQKKEANVWQEYFLSDAFLREQRDDSFGEALLSYFMGLSDEEFKQLPKKFIMELVIAYGLLPEAFPSGEEGQVSFRVVGDGSFLGRNAAAEVYNRYIGNPESTTAMFLYRTLTNKTENRLRAGSFGAYLSLCRLNEEGHLNASEQERWDPFLYGAEYHKLTVFHDWEHANFQIHSKIILQLLTFWVRNDSVPQPVLDYMFDTYELHQLDSHSSKYTMYGALKEAILEKCPDLEQRLYGDFSIIHARKQFLKQFHDIVMRTYHDAFHDEQRYEDSDEVRQRVNGLFAGSDWEMVRTDEETFREIYDIVSNYELMPDLVAEYLLRYCDESKGLFDYERITQIEQNLLRALGYMQHARELDETRTYVYERTGISDIAPDNEPFMFYLLTKGFGNFRPEHPAPVMPLFLEEYYHANPHPRQQWDEAPGWQKQFTGFDEATDAIEHPVRDEVALEGGQKLVVEFHLHYILYLLDGEVLSRPVYSLSELSGLAESLSDPVRFFYLLAVTSIQETERDEAMRLIWAYLEQTCIRPQLWEQIVQMLVGVCMWTPEQDRLRIVWEEQERFCFCMTVREDGVRLFRKTKAGFDELALPEGEEEKLAKLSFAEKVAFCQKKLKGLLLPLPVRSSHMDISGLSNAEKIRTVWDAMKENGYVVLHIGNNEGRVYDRIFWSDSHFDMGSLMQIDQDRYQENMQRMQKKIREPYEMIGSYGWEKGYFPGNWRTPFPVALGESGTYYSYIGVDFHKAKTLFGLLEQILDFGMVTAMDTYAGKLRVSEYDGAFVYGS